ncbi:MAG: UDP-glucose:undecaprenyl-phosphate glucose-1-phosphate transferase [Candidatus Omnitrophica bacterium]|nr:UDP-glucose:undecaprenyl-phosphate glucose-1-phosphate transferase [Candidatus Omnitrophota bacterium]
MILPRRRVRDTFLPWVQLACDILTIVLLLKAAFWVRFTSGYLPSRLGVPDYPMYLRVFPLIALIIVLFLRHYDLYRASRTYRVSEEAWRILKAVAAAVVVLMAVTFFIRGFTFSRTFLVTACAVVAVGLIWTRYLLAVVVMHVDRKRGSFRNVLILGCTEESRKLIRYYRKNPRLSTRVVGFLDDLLRPNTIVDGVPVAGPLTDLAEYIRQHRQVHEVVLAVPGLPAESVLRVLYECEKQMVGFRWISDLFGMIAAKMTVVNHGSVSLLCFKDSPLADWENRFLKRTMDIALSAAALVLLSPFLALIALWIALDSKGPVLFGQQRIGQDGRRFVILKFRTMRTDAEKRSGPVWAQRDDPRRTRVGSFLRKTNLDELPQLWNVLRGDMSLVGPRPERPFFVSRFKDDIPRYMARHSIRSGITGWAQVNGLRGNTSIEERTKFDLYYIENWSMLLDLKILCMTLFARENAY